MYRYLTTKRINQIAWKLLQKAGVEEPWVDVRKIAEQYLNMEIKVDALGDDISGLLITKGGRAIIGLNESESWNSNRQRFTIAHEIGHFVLEHQREGMFVDQHQTQFAIFYRDEKTSEGSYQQEIEANAFAAALLMPEEFVKAEIKKLMQKGDSFDLSGDNDAFIKKLAKEFKVSTMAMTYRIGNLNLFNTM